MTAELKGKCFMEEFIMKYDAAVLQCLGDLAEKLDEMEGISVRNASKIIVGFSKFAELMRLEMFGEETIEEKAIKNILDILDGGCKNE